MQIVREPTGDSTTRLDEIRLAYTPPMRRMCAHLTDEPLREMVERMARHKLAEKRAKRLRSSARATGRPRRTAAAPPVMMLAS